jgi:sirohydrochlorin cobaltochelatase
MANDSAILICGHGSRDIHAVAEFESLSRVLACRLRGRMLEAGYLEFARPTIRESLEALRTRGARHILAVPGMLFAAGHVKNDIPSELNEFTAAYPEIDVRYGRDLGLETHLLQAARDRIEAAELRAPGPREDTILVVVGRGTSDPDANSNIAKVARMLGEGMGFGWSLPCFSGVAQPRVGTALDRAARLGFSRLIVFPYFLFTGRLVKRIREETREAAARHAQLSFIEADYLNDHPGVIETFLARIAEAEGERPAMNCQICKYRERLPGYEAEVGRPQAGHHHHVRGIGVDAPAQPHGHSHSHAHPHDHSHDD